MFILDFTVLHRLGDLSAAISMCRTLKWDKLAQELTKGYITGNYSKFDKLLDQIAPRKIRDKLRSAARFYNRIAAFRARNQSALDTSEGLAPEMPANLTPNLEEIEEILYLMTKTETEQKLYHIRQILESDESDKICEISLKHTMKLDILQWLAYHEIPVRYASLRYVPLSSLPKLPVKTKEKYTQTPKNFGQNFGSNPNYNSGNQNKRKKGPRKLAFL